MNDLGLDIASLTRPGRKPSAVGGTFVRELGVEDLEELSAHRGTEPPEVKRLTERHHALARALASGMTEGEAGAMVGLLPARVSVLKGSPAFQELLALYREQKDRQFIETAARLAGLAQDAVIELQERLETEPEKISTGQLVEITKMAADRSGNGPTSTVNQNVNVDLSARLEQARQRALEHRKMKDITPPELDHE